VIAIASGQGEPAAIVVWFITANFAKSILIFNVSRIVVVYLGDFVSMVCQKCEKKLSTIITPDTWKTGARNTLESGGRKLNENKLLSQSSKTKAAVGSSNHQFLDCRICKAKCHQMGSHYCQQCAYKKSICSMCGIRIASTKDHNQTSA